MKIISRVTVAAPWCAVPIQIPMIGSWSEWHLSGKAIVELSSHQCTPGYHTSVNGSLKSRACDLGYPRRKFIECECHVAYSTDCETRSGNKNITQIPFLLFMQSLKINRFTMNHPSSPPWYHETLYGVYEMITLDRTDNFYNASHLYKYRHISAYYPLVWCDKSAPYYPQYQFQWGYVMHCLQCLTLNTVFLPPIFLELHSLSLIRGLITNVDFRYLIHGTHQ